MSTQLRSSFRNLLKYFSNRAEKRFEPMSKVRYFDNPYLRQEEGASNVQEQVATDTIQNFIGEILKDIEKNVKPTPTLDDGLYVGTPGISYMYYHLHKNPRIKNKPDDDLYLKKAEKYLQPNVECLKRTRLNKKDVPSFILGCGGIYALASAVNFALGNKKESDDFRKLYYEASKVCKDLDFLGCGSDELFVGRAGYILGALWLAKETQTEPLKQDLYQLCDLTVESGRKYAHLHNSRSPLMYSYYKVEYLGAAHGLSAILQALISVPGYLEATSQRNAKDIKASVDYLLSLQDQEGNFPCDSSEIGQAYNLVHWCHGAPGIIYLMVKAYLVWKEDKYLRSCLQMGELIWQRGLLKKGPGICHGVAGNAYSFLILYRLTGDTKHLHRAGTFTKFMRSPEFVRKARRPDCPYSLYEGTAGTACFLSDLTNPQEAAFPFFDVFS